MSTVINAIMERYSCRDFTGEALSHEDAAILADAALAAPSAMNQQPWHIIVVTDKTLIDEMDKDAMTQIAQQNPDWHARIQERGGKVFYNAPCLVVIAKNDSAMATLDCGIVSQNITLAAHGLGLGSVICAMARMLLDGANSDTWRRRLQIPDGYNFGMAVCVGKVASGKPPHELDRGKVTFIN